MHFGVFGANQLLLEVNVRGCLGIISRLGLKLSLGKPKLLLKKANSSFLG